MAGKFLSLEEAARQLGVTVDEVHRFVDRKKLFPMRDGATIKFKVDDVERLVHDLADEGSQGDDLGLSLDLDGPASMPADEPHGLDAGDLVLGDALDAGDSLFADDGDAAPASHTIVRGAAAGDAAAGGGSELSMPSVSGASSADIVFGDSAVGGGAAGDNLDLDLESIVGASSIGASSPSLAPATSGITGGPGEIDETLAIDLGDALPTEPGGSFAVGSDAGLAGSPEATGAGLALSGALDSGLSLEEGGLEVSGIDLGGGSGAGVAVDDGTVLGGDDFELGGGGGDDDSASVVIAEGESGDSSFFGQALGSEASAFGDESVGLPSSIASEAMGMPGDFAPEMAFSVWQTAGLICCSLLLLFGGFIAYDLVRTIGSPESTTLANPLLNAMADAFGWR
ncbi:MAG: helix-turn-helix domain-containing protein [Pirellulales bacterium]